VRILFSLKQNLNGRRRCQVTSHEAQSTVAEGRNGTEGTVTILLDRKQASVSRVEGETLLESARRAGLSPPFSCEAGNCGTCMARLTDGRATMRVNDALDEDEVADGYILTCQAVPDTPSVSVEYE
jgi:ferredoxin